VTATLGDTVTFTNSDQAAHIVAAAKLGLKSPAISPGGVFTYVVTRSGSWQYQVSDSAGKHQLPGTLLAAKPGDVTLNAPSTIRYGARLALRGTTPLATFPVAIELRQGHSWTTLSEVTPSRDGSFSLEVSPRLRTEYRADVLGGQLLSSARTVAVLPRLSLRSSSRRIRTGSKVRLTAHVVPVKAAKSLAFQMYNRAKKHWYLVGSGTPNRHGNVVVSLLVGQGYSRLRAATHGLTKGFTRSYSPTIVLVGLGAPPKHKKH
jgi:hypothetical protein